MDEITIRGYKSIRDQTVEIRPINVLIGGNGAGKSNFISFFQFLRALHAERLESSVNLAGGTRRLLYHGPAATSELGATLRLEGGTTYSFKLMERDSIFHFEEEEFCYNKDCQQLAASGTESNLHRLGLSAKTHSLVEFLKYLRVYHFEDTGSNSPFTQLSHQANDAYYLYFDGSNLAAILNRIRAFENLAYRRIVKVIRSVADYFEDFFFQPNEKHFLRLQWRDRYSDYVYGPEDLSDGTLRYIALTALFLQPELPKLIIIEEPELGLHPRAIAKLSGMIKQASRRGSKVIVATQSTALISYFEPEDIITVDNVDGASQFNRLRMEDLEQWLEEYTLGDLWSRNIIVGGQP